MVPMTPPGYSKKNIDYNNKRTYSRSSHLMLWKSELEHTKSLSASYAYSNCFFVFMVHLNCTAGHCQKGKVNIFTCARTIM